MAANEERTHGYTQHHRSLLRQVLVGMESALTFLFTGNDITDLVKKRALLLTLSGVDRFGIMRALVTPRTSVEVPYHQLISLLGPRFGPKPSERFSRCNFQCRNRLVNVPVRKYVASLKTRAINCNFGIHPIARTPASSGEGAAASMESESPFSVSTMLPLDIMLRGWFACDIHDTLLQQRFFAKQDLNIQKTFDLAHMCESATKQR